MKIGNLVFQKRKNLNIYDVYINFKNGGKHLFCICSKHGKIWKQGSSFKDGACKKCVLNIFKERYKRIGLGCEGIKISKKDIEQCRNNFRKQIEDFENGGWIDKTLQ